MSHSDISDVKYNNLDVSIDGAVATITLDNPPANTWTYDSLQSFKQLLNDLSNNPEVCALVIHGQGEKFFCAGADLNLFASDDVEDNKKAVDMVMDLADIFEQLSNYKGVSIAMINGYAMGGGLECALACDIRIAEDNAVMALPEASVGLLPCAGGTQNLPWLVGEGWAKRMILCGERIDANTALQIGLVEEVVAKGEGLKKAQALASKVAKQSPNSVDFCKNLIQSARHTAPAHNLINERENFLRLFGSHNQKEGVQAFLGKRPPVWQKLKS